MNNAIKEMVGNYAKRLNLLEADKFSCYSPYYSRLLSADVPNVNNHNPFLHNANIALKDLNKTTVEFRAQKMKSLSEEFEKNRDFLAALITEETGKTIKESHAEVSICVATLNYFSEIAPTFPFSYSVDKFNIRLRPVGPVLLVTPWNFPLSMIVRALGPILTAGCSVIVKPSEETPLTAIYVDQLCEKIGLPKNAVTAMTCARENVNKLVDDLVCDDGKNHGWPISKISFTGSSVVGKHLIKLSSNNVTRLTMELGGNAPFIVTDKADIEHAVKNLLTSKIRNNGQACNAPNRIFVHLNILENFLNTLKEQLSTKIIGDPYNSNTNFTCLINKKAVSRVEEHLKRKDFEIFYTLKGGKSPNRPNIIDPTILLYKESDIDYGKTDDEFEFFSPVFAVYPFSDLNILINEKISQSKYGLAAYTFTNDRNEIELICDSLDAGMVCVNNTQTHNVNTPFGGIKNSGVGREYGFNSVYNYLEPRSFNIS